MIENQSHTQASRTDLPDISAEAPRSVAMSGALDWVGMSGIEVPVLLKDSQGAIYRTAAKASAFVSLESNTSRGIHMSRLFKELQDELSGEQLGPAVINKILEKFLSSHQGLSEKAKLEIEFQALILRPALVSENKGWRTYPVKISGELNNKKELGLFLEIEVSYSSTCPASAALSRQLIQENFKLSFKNQDLNFKEVFDFLGTSRGINATPHAQRSVAKVKVEISEDSKFSFENLIDAVEEALQTPVQTVVKREDEQEFALRNGQNLMFCEDAARRIQTALNENSQVLAFAAEVRHLESLHPHDAVAMVQGRKQKS